jgi:dimethylhistidine N-methyltransferase
MLKHEKEIALAVNGCDILLDLGAGNCEKGSQLFDSIRPKKFRALDISKDFLELAITDLQKRFPSIEMQAQVCDLSQPLELSDLAGERKLFFYPGSSIGNFDPQSAHSFLSQIAQFCEGKGGLLIGVDLIKNTDVLNQAYDDALGVTAAFNLNALRHINRLIGSNFRETDWAHFAFFNTSKSRVEMHLKALRDVVITLPGTTLEFKAGESIHTENSYKYTQETFTELLIDCGFKTIKTWSDEQGYFLVCYASAEH